VDRALGGPIPATRRPCDDALRTGPSQTP
jgi:hypothetical protein